MAKVLIAATVPDDMAWIWLPPMARGGTMPFCLIFFGFSIRHLRRATPMLVSDFVVIGDVPDARLRFHYNPRCKVRDELGTHLPFDLVRVSTLVFSRSVPVCLFLRI
jgi:hypothetical protein